MCPLGFPSTTLHQICAAGPHTGWAVPLDNLGNLTVTVPAAAVIATTGTAKFDWAGLNADTRCLGIVTYHNIAAPTNYDDGRIGTTIVRVDTD